MLLGDNGWINRRIKYVKSCQTATNVHDENNPNLMNVMESQNAEEDLECLKRAVISNVDDGDLLLKLNSTRQLRKQLMTKNKTDIREMFPFLLSHPELVSLNANLNTLFRCIRIIFMDS